MVRDDTYAAPPGFQQRNHPVCNAFHLGLDLCGQTSAQLVPQFVKAPGWRDATCDLHLKPGSPGASGAPLPEKLAPIDFEGKERVEGGPLGAFATVAKE